MSLKPPLTLEEACAKLDGLDIVNNTVAKQVFCQIAIEYSRDELRKEGVELLALVTPSDLHTFCHLWLKEQPGIAIDMALIALSLAIRTKAHDQVKQHQ